MGDPCQSPLEPAIDKNLIRLRATQREAAMLPLLSYYQSAQLPKTKQCRVLVTGRATRLLVYDNVQSLIASFVIAITRSGQTESLRSGIQIRLISIQWKRLLLSKSKTLGLAQAVTQKMYTTYAGNAFKALSSLQLLTAVASQVKRSRRKPLILVFMAHGLSKTLAKVLTA